MSDRIGGDSERVAPIIPLFGAKTPAGRAAKPVPLHEAVDTGSPSERHPARGAAARRAAEQSGTEQRSGSDGPSGLDAVSEQRPRLRALLETDDAPADDAPSADEARATAEEALVRKLRSRSLSVSEARLVLRGHGLAGDQTDDVIDEFRRRGYLDDVVLAELLVSSGVERKGQGRVALSRALAQRGIPRDVIDAALDVLPDDDEERALEFARTRARSMGRLDSDTALRRLVGQLGRRGYNGKVAMTAAKKALGEIGSGGASGVRFVDSD